MVTAQFAFNMASIEYQVETALSNKVTPLKKWSWEEEPLGKLYLE